MRLLSVAQVRNCAATSAAKPCSSWATPARRCGLHSDEARVNTANSLRLIVGRGVPEAPIAGAAGRRDGSPRLGCGLPSAR
ncbi:hypothetical protein NDU88_005339 [Pleurodeles waltl]|uniref:Uncharacterized protein n=1 Tax=Pleurodeles waltl TaxID=8319 RepID=A0AAV7RI82_PLEWA|nr:hypothetical protein NDU88_005339 [Pleurodeles waltl]